MRGLKKAAHLPPLKTTLANAKKTDVLELDEMQHWLPGRWLFVCRRQNKRGVWLAQCRRTRQIIAYAIRSHSEATCRVLWERIPKRYKKCICYTDFWAAYAEVLPAEQHRATGKGAGHTCHIERFNNILRQR